ncbi:MAG: putative protease YdeA [Pseudomonas citronellolis]|nr:MAG: putative protease YdeA [Pseudomonas citronellolis]
MHGTLYVYLTDTLSDWELAYLMPALHMARDAGQYTGFQLRTVANTVQPVRTAGGLTILPDCRIEHIDQQTIAGLILPGADSWAAAEHQPVLEQAEQCLERGQLLAAICGATLALADRGLLEQRLHTSNSLQYLAGLSATYRGQANYRTQLAVSDGNLITASAAGALLFARKVLEYFSALPAPMIEAWYDYHLTGDARYFMTFSHLKDTWTAQRAGL